MIFPYLEVVRHGGVRSLPIIPIRLHGPLRHVDLLALVDSGAEQSVVNFKLIEYLGLAAEGAVVVQIIGVGGKESRGYVIDVDHQLRNYRWQAPVVFSEAIEAPVILGQAGFFEHFNVTFKRRSALMDIRRTR
ncbi:MAG: hypothetical protein K8U03_24020 [Planctomycetia bacterium]|nr:hypothetical protein [Planctomycetia bacterium]